jgi:hypothetical protein
MAKNRTGIRSADVKYETVYGGFRGPFAWLGGVVFVIGIVGIPVGIFANEGCVLNNHPLEPWAATLIVEVFAVGALLTAVYMTALTWYSRKSPQRIAVTAETLVVPKGAFSKAELVLPFDEIRTSVFDVGFVKQLQIRHGRKKILLTSARFSSDDDFAQLVGHLPNV